MSGTLLKTTRWRAVTSKVTLPTRSTGKWLFWRRIDTFPARAGAGRAAKTGLESTDSDDCRLAMQAVGVPSASSPLILTGSRRSHHLMIWSQKHPGVDPLSATRRASLFSAEAVGDHFRVLLARAS